MKGTVRWYNDIKGYGFITGENDEDIFIHSSNLNEIITQGMELEFDVEKTPKGYSALNVKVL